MYDGSTLTLEEAMRFLESAPANIFFKDTECKYRFVTDMCKHLNGGKEHSVLGKTDLEIQVDPDLGRFYYKDDLKILETGEGSEYVSDCSAADEPCFFEIKKRPVMKDGSIIGIIGVINDVTDRVLLERQLEELSFRDKLTGLYNRNYLESRKTLYRRDDVHPHTLIMADCNFLKTVNDTLGHEYGDMLLRRAADAIREAIPDGCIAIRTGGDEFLISCPGVGETEARGIIDGIRTSCTEKSDPTVTVELALGSFTVQGEDLLFDEALRRADEAMYEDKRRCHKTRGHAIASTASVDNGKAGPDPQ